MIIGFYIMIIGSNILNHIRVGTFLYNESVQHSDWLFTPIDYFNYWYFEKTVDFPLNWENEKGREVFLFETALYHITGISFRCTSYCSVFSDTRNSSQEKSQD